MSLWPRISWAMCGGMPLRIASVAKILRKSCGVKSQGLAVGAGDAGGGERGDERG